MRAALKGTELNMQPTVIKGIVHPKIEFVIIYSLTCCPKPVLNFFHVLNTKEDILKNVGNQTVAGPLDCRIKKNTMEVTVDQQLFK